MATVEFPNLTYIGPNSETQVSTQQGVTDTATITFAAATLATRARRLFIEVSHESQTALPVAVDEHQLCFIFVDAIRINGGPSLVNGSVPIALFYPNVHPIGGFPEGELNMQLNVGDIVTVEVRDQDPAGIEHYYGAQLKCDTRPTNTGANTGALVVGKELYYLGIASALGGDRFLTILDAAQGEWRSPIVADDLVVSYWFQTCADGTEPNPFGVMLVDAHILPAAANPRLTNYVAGFPASMPNDAITAPLGNSTAALGIANQVQYSLQAGEQLSLTFQNEGGSTRFVAVGCYVVNSV